MERTAIYGAGVYGEIFCSELELNNIDIDFFIDQFTDKKKLANKSVYKLEEISFDELTIYISITSPKAELFVINHLRDLGIKNIFTFIGTLNKFKNLIPRCVKHTKTWYTDDKTRMINEKKLEKLEALLSDDKSKQLLNKVKDFRNTLSSTSYLTPDLEAQYFPNDIDLFKQINKIRFIDGGAYIGDTLAESIIEFNKLGKEVEYIASFEPDSKNLFQLKSEVIKQKDIHPDINLMIYPSGLWSSNTVLQFNSNNTSSSAITENQNSENLVTIMATTIDTTLIGTAPNYIKMDVEGAEKEAILGARETISKYSPVLAICLYHKPEDIWEIPLLINSINQNYDMYLRIYGSMGLELVLYCVPKANV